jgi:hypothetical protein
MILYWTTRAVKAIFTFLGRLCVSGTVCASPALEPLDFRLIYGQTIVFLSTIRVVHLLAILIIFHICVGTPIFE